MIKKIFFIDILDYRSPMPFKHAIVLTGGIATGKSTSSQFLSQRGWHIIDADKIAHEILDQEHHTIAKMFGNAFVFQNKVDRKKLGGIIFTDPQAKKALEDLLHPLIYQEIAHQSTLQDQKNSPYLIDIPLFFETQRYPIKKSILVYATPSQQLQRLMKRNNFTQQEAQQRINAQMNIEHKRTLATYIIDNQSTLDALQAECDRITNIIKQS